MRKDKVKNILFILYIVAVLLMTAVLFPFFKAFTSEEGLLALEQSVENAGALGVFLMLGLQILQIVVAIIPGEVVEFVSGVMFGTFGGLLLDMIGIAIGQTMIYYLVAKLGENFVNRVAGSKTVSKLSFLQNEQKVNLVLFFLYFIPGTPKDALCYVAPLFKIPYQNFILISLVARIPSVVTSTYAGATLMDKDIVKTIIIYVFMAVLSVAGIVMYRLFVKGREKHGKHKSNRQQ